MCNRNASKSSSILTNTNSRNTKLTYYYTTLCCGLLIMRERYVTPPLKQIEICVVMHPQHIVVVFLRFTILNGYLLWVEGSASCSSGACSPWCGFSNSVVSINSSCSMGSKLASWSFSPPVTSFPSGPSVLAGCSTTLMVMGICPPSLNSLERLT